MKQVTHRILKKIILLFFLACVFAKPLMGWCAKPDSELDSRYDDQSVLTPEFLQTYKEFYFIGKRREAYDQWLQQAWQGDLYAMATLPAVTVTHTDQTWPVPPEFWEHWVLDLLGEAEGSYVLGLQYALIAEAVGAEGLPAKKRRRISFCGALLPDISPVCTQRL